MSASLPHPRIPIIDQNGLITPDWYRFLAQFQRDFSGSETVPGSGLTLDAGVLGIADDGVTNDKLRDSLALSVIGRPLNSVGDPQDMVATGNGRFLQRDGDLLTFRYPKLPSFISEFADCASYAIGKSAPHYSGGGLPPAEALRQGNQSV
jgi:hypothetical protein